MRQWLWLYPAVEITHIVGFVVLVRSAFMFDLRLLRLSRALPVSAMATHLLRWARLALLLVVPSGVLMFVAHATEFATNGAFQLKLTLIALAFLNAGIFHRWPFRVVGDWEHRAGCATPRASPAPSRSAYGSASSPAAASSHIFSSAMLGGDEPTTRDGPFSAARRGIVRSVLELEAIACPLCGKARRPRSSSSAISRSACPAVTRSFAARAAGCSTRTRASGWISSTWRIRPTTRPTAKDPEISRVARRLGPAGRRVLARRLGYRHLDPGELPLAARLRVAPSPAGASSRRSCRGWARVACSTSAAPWAASWG